jgi:CRP-like cAMP-binding protein
MVEHLIKNITRHVELRDDEMAVIASSFTARKFRKRHYLLQEGELSRNEYFIVKGLTRTYKVDQKGQEHVVGFGPEDWWVGDLSSFLSGLPSYYNVDCLEDTEVLLINRPDLEMLYQKVPKMERYFRVLTQNALIAATSRVVGTLAKTAPERYALFIERYPQIEQRVPNHQIASYLGITPQSLSRIRAKAAIGNK